MKQKKIKLTALTLFVLGITGLQAQEAIPSSGGNAAGSGGSVSYSIGQLVYTTNTGTNGSIAQGVQQPFEIAVITALIEAKEITLGYSVYPNPVSENVQLNTENYETQNLTYQLLDISGKLLERKKIIGNETIISMGNFTHAAYFLKITDNNKEIKTFKIIKN